MAAATEQTPHILFSTSQECAAYLFNLRWPGGFICPFCHRPQKKVAPACTVVCRFCRKQTSITAHTVMHGTRNSLLSWMLVAWQFSIRNEGISAREVQKLLELSSYQTAWRWLQKIRRGAALAEKAPCSGNVLFDVRSIHNENKYTPTPMTLVTALECNPAGDGPARLKFRVLETVAPDALLSLAAAHVTRDSTLFISNKTETAHLLPAYRIRPATRNQSELAAGVIAKAISWLSSTHRKAITGTYLQDYLDEFVFRHNTSSWPDRLTVFEHLLTGLLNTDDWQKKGGHPIPSGTPPASPTQAGDVI